MGAALTPTQVANFRANTAANPYKALNLKQKMCQGECRQKRSIGQFNQHSAICDRCFKRMPKTA